MATAEQLREAISLLKYNDRRIGQRHSRIHEDTALENVNRIRALQGVCGQCVNLGIEIKRVDGKDKVILRCKAGMSPLDLYRKTPLGTFANCVNSSRQPAA